MENQAFSRTVIKSSNPAVLKECFREFISGNLKEFGYWKEKEGDKEFAIDIAYGAPGEKLAEISTRFPGEVIKEVDSCFFEADPHKEIYHYEYKDGKRTVVDIEPNYVTCYWNVPEIPSWDEVKEKAFSFFEQRLDVTRKDAEGEPYIDWFDEKVTYEFQHEVEGVKYKVRATKVCSEISFQVFRGEMKFDWYEVRRADNDLPF